MSEQSTVAVIDYGMGNLHSVAKALEHAAPGARVTVSADPAVIRAADRVVFPGVGAIRDCMAEIRRLGFDQVVKEIAQSGKPLLGICVGMQAMMAFSEENGGVDCLNLFPGRVRFFGDPLLDDDGNKLKVPHMGWNQVRQAHPHPVWEGIPDNSRFYFVHSYYVDAADAAEIAGSCDYSVTFAAAIAHQNVFATQFHPEKSQEMGLRLLGNFMRWDGTV